VAVPRVECVVADWHAERAALERIRRAVFIEEQQISAND
jgi:hypothetical protein